MNNKLNETIQRFASLESSDVATAISVFANLNANEREALMHFATLSDADRAELFDYWSKLWGPEYARAETLDYIPRGTKKRVEAALSSSDRNVVKDYYDNLYGSEYAGDMVEDHKPAGKTQTTEASRYMEFLKSAADSKKN